MSCLYLVFCAGLATSSVEEAGLHGQGLAEVDRSPVSSSVDQEHWLDRWQDNLTDSMDYTVKQLDSFFAMEDSTMYEDAKAEGRIRLGWEPRSRDLAETDLRFRIRVTLPSLENRVDLLLSDNEDFQQEDTIKAAREPAFRGGDSTTLSLRFKRDVDSHFSHRIGAGRRDQLYVKSQYEDVVAFNEAWALRYDAELYYYTRDRLGAEIGTSFQYISPHDHVMRFNHRFYFRDDSNDWLWRHELQQLQPINTNNALVYSVLVEGLSQPTYQIEEVYTSVRWRTNPLRDWLYFEVEPFVLWLREEDFKASYGVALRVEAFYGKEY
ncbi:hypothetical protein [Alteromonas antoniana]|uniref:hypothetical protein n=1 Tax=Alteromonas antoniana TaxID=2803813 RepID=UPI001C44A9DD|nr:hypothetical protein [Alteromonas antoniana]